MERRRLCLLPELLPAAAKSWQSTRVHKQSVDGLNVALEISARSSYVPALPIGA
jgi:hypothetical protein